MRHPLSRARTWMVSFSLPLFGWSCASSPATWELKSDHPASPTAEQTEFIPPPKIFVQEVGEMPMDEMGQEEEMDHSKMDHSKMDHSGMDHSKMDHSKMDHSGMDHSGVDDTYQAGDSDTEESAEPPPAARRS